MNKELIIKSLLWDYTISPAEIERLINGEVERVYHYTFDTLMHKMIQNLPWYTIISIVPLERLKKVMTQQFVDSIRQPSLRKQYKYVRNKLQTIVFPSNEGVTII